MPDPFDMIYEYPDRLMIRNGTGGLKRVGGAPIETIAHALRKGLRVRYATRTQKEMDTLIGLIRAEQKKQKGVK